ncbi:MAG: DNA translocase FtsK 4TM domain-containing protein, partial [Bacteroidaceae bacterium]|nr:DNA translocase FtsK 4TM domain-containing protein [Bacteroidaceae bacterium]
MRIAVGSILLFAAVIMAISFISYCFTGEYDMNYTFRSVGEVIDKNPATGQRESSEVHNLMSVFGLNVATLFMSKGIGLSAFILVIWLVISGFKLLANKGSFFFSYTFVSAASVITFTLFLAAIDYFAGPLTFYPLGGNLGYQCVDILGAITGLIGIILTVALVLLLWVLLCFNTIKTVLIQLNKVLPKPEKNKRNSVDGEDGELALSDFKGDSHDAINPVDDNDVVVQHVEEKVIKNQPIMKEEFKADDEPQLEETMTIAKPIEQAKKLKDDAYDPTATLSHFKMPHLELLDDIEVKQNCVDRDEQESNKTRIKETLLNYGIEIKRIEAHVGPSITLFEIVPKEGVKIAKIKNLEDDIALSLSALGIRIIAPMPGRGTIGIEVPNKDPQIVPIRSVIGSKAFQDSKAALPMALGVTVSNEVFIADLAKMPHLLVAGATGQGKSVGLNAIIASLLYKRHPAELKFVLVDPKSVEFSLYKVLEKHYLARLEGEDTCIITKCEKVIATLNSLVMEMENRYKLLEIAGERNVKDYNARFISRNLNPENGHKFMPYIVCIIDEFADLIMVAGKEIETPIVRIAQKARAVGIHMIVATQRPSTNVITGLIKANFPGRVAFRVTQMVDSRTIIDRSGAQQLVGRGDMLFSADGDITRLQCPLVDTPDVKSVCEFISEQIGYSMPYE